MALNVPTHTNPNTGVTVSNAYATITSYNGDQSELRFIVSFFTSNPSTNSNMIQPFDTKQYQIETSLVSGASSLYNYLQTLPEFSGSTVD